MNHTTCKHYNGDHHNTHCGAGVCYRDVTTEPDRLEGSAFRKPCVDWDKWHGYETRPWDNEKQKQEWALTGHCDKWEAPTQAEIDADEAEWKQRADEIVESLNRGVVPPGVIACGPGTVGKCKCSCPESCEHVWDGEPVEEEDMATRTCSRCGKWAMNHDMWVLP